MFKIIRKWQFVNILIEWNYCGWVDNKEKKNKAEGIEE